MPSRTFEDTVLPHLDAAFNYARWLTKDDVEAEDVVQDACVRAIRFFPSVRNDNARAWLLAIVRNTWFSRVSRRRSPRDVGLEEEHVELRDDALDPEGRLLQQHAIRRVRAAIEQLPSDFVRSSCFAISKGCRTRRSRRCFGFRTARSCRASQGHASD